MSEGGEIIAICQFGGEFVTSSDGCMSYSGGEAHAIDIDRAMLFDDFKLELSSVFNTDISHMTIKYFLPNNKRTLITVSCDKDLQRMIDFNASLMIFNVFIMKTSVIASPSIDAGAVNLVNRKGRQQKRTIANINGGRITRSRGRLANSSAPEVVVATIENSGQQRPSAAESAENGENWITPVSTDYIAPSNTTTSDDPANYSLSIFYGDSHDIITGVGQEFDNVKDFRDKMCEYAISKGFTYKFVKNETVRATVKCTAENCPWRLHASQTTRKKKIIIKKFIDVHTCAGGTADGGQRRMTKKWLVNMIKKKLRDSPECKPRDIADEIYRDYGVNVSYFQVWHAKTHAEKELFNMHIEACKQLPWFCERILDSNPGSAVILATSADSRFRMFVSFYASLHGFEHGCRPLVFLDTIPLKRNNQMRLLAASAIDGDDAIFPLAFAAVEAENYDSWLWFLEQLKYALKTSSAITFVSSRHNGLMESVPQIFEDSFHSYCLVDLMDNFRAELKKGSWTQEEEDAMVNDFECAAQACTTEEFDGHIESIRKLSNGAAYWVMAAKPEHWSNALFKGSRYNHFSADASEFSDWISIREESSVVLMVDAICSKMMEITHARRESSKAWETILTPSMEQKLKKELSKARKFEVLCSSDTIFEVRGTTVNVVNSGTWECTCRMWQINGLPCIHAIAVFDHVGRSVYDYCSRFFTVECYCATYLESINRIPDVERISSIVRTNPYKSPGRQPKGPKKPRNRDKQR